VSSSDKRDPERKPLESTRPTVRPTVAPEQLARRPEARPTPGGMRAIREPQATITNELELEEARLESMRTSLPGTSGAPANGAVSESAAAAPGDRPAEMRECFGLGDYAGALERAEAILAESPRDGEATRVAADCRETLTELYEGKLGALDRVPFVVVAREELRWLAIDHRAGFLLSHVDGVSSLETILDVSGMPRLDALRILVELVQKRVVSLR
jgi:hypothetical protein